MPYTPPEQIKDGNVGPEADLYSTGAVLYELLTGHRAFPDGPKSAPFLPPSQRKPSLPRHLDEFFAQALAPDPQDRFSSADQMQQSFLDALGSVAPSTPDGIAAWIDVLYPPSSSKPTPVMPPILSHAPATVQPVGHNRVSTSRAVKSGDDSDSKPNTSSYPGIRPPTESTVPP